MASPISGVTFLCDFLRADVSGGAGGVDRLASWWHSALKRQITRACGLPVELFTTSTNPMLAAWVTALRPAAQADVFWATCYDRLPEAMQQQSRQQLAALQGRFCIGYEMPPYLARLLDRLAIPYLDIRIHPIRFLDDLIFAVRASHAPTQQALRGFCVSESSVLITAGLREAMCRHIGNASVPPHTLLVLGQRRFDSTQITGGAFYDASHHEAAIRRICAGHDAIILKPHPLDTAHSLLTVTAAAPNAIGVVNDNIYRMLAVPEITAVLSVSSSVAYEAAYFGKTVHSLAPLPVQLAWRDQPIEPGQHASLDEVVLSIDFWREILAPHTDVTSPDGIRLAAKPNRLRLALDSFWNFNQIDSDRLPARS